MAHFYTNRMAKRLASHCLVNWHYIRLTVQQTGEILQSVLKKQTTIWGLTEKATWGPEGFSPITTRTWIRPTTRMSLEEDSLLYQASKGELSVAGTSMEPYKILSRRPTCKPSAQTPAHRNHEIINVFYCNLLSCGNLLNNNYNQHRDSPYCFHLFLVKHALYITVDGNGSQTFLLFPQHQIRIVHYTHANRCPQDLKSWIKKTWIFTENSNSNIKNCT